MSHRPWIDAAATLVAEREFTDELTVTRTDRTQETVNTTTGIVTPVITTIWTGYGFVSAARPQRTTSAAGVKGVTDDREVEATHRVSLPLEVGIVQAGDQITIYDSDNVDLISQVFDVIADVEVSSRVRRQVWCKRVRPDIQR